jgi:phage-related protein
VRSELGHARIARVIFCVHEGQTVLLHGFMKKTKKTPKGDLDVAIKRMKGIT